VSAGEARPQRGTEMRDYVNTEGYYRAMAEGETLPEE